MKRAILALLFVFAVTSLSAQTKKKPEPKIEVSSISTKPESPATPQILNFRIESKLLNLIIIAIQSSTQLDANTSNELVKFLITQVNDTTLNKQTPLPKGQ